MNYKRSSLILHGCSLIIIWNGNCGAFSGQQDSLPAVVHQCLKYTQKTHILNEKLLTEAKELYSKKLRVG